MNLKVFGYISLVIVIVSIFAICTFKVLDRDFWWHVKAGEIMWNTGELIKTDPFAHTRIGQPYLSSHQWLAQIIFYGVWNISGATAEIFFRGFLVATAFSLLLLIDRKCIWPNFFVILIAAYFNRPSFMDRPQLFSFVFFCAFLFAATYYLRRSEKSGAQDTRWRYLLFGILVALQIVWVNMHGAAATYGIIVMCAVLAELGVAWLRSPDAPFRSRAFIEVRFIGGCIVALIASALISPNGLNTIRDVFVYTSDQTLGIVREWQPRGLNGYMKDIAPFLVLAVVSIYFGKRHRVFAVALLLIMGYLSTQAYRHGIFFIFSALAIAIYEFGSNAQYRKWISAALSKPVAAGIGSIAVLGCMFWYADYHDINVLQREGYSGYGSAAAAEDAYNFIEQHNIQGKMFNTYAIGDYLLYRGYPNRLVYMDGRNIDYGYDFLREASLAGFEGDTWAAIENKYELTYAVIEYPLPPGYTGDSDLPYVTHLDNNKDWALVYLDDKVAVYLKRISENQALITKYEYKRVTPESIEFGKAFEGIKDDNVATVEMELERAARGSKKSIKAKLLLVHHYVQTGNFGKAAQFANAAVDAQPHRPEVYEALGIVAAGMKQWARAGAYLEESIAKTGGVGLPVNYGYIADIFANAGDVAKSSYYRQKAK